MNLVQIKEFNEQTVTVDVARIIGTLICWSGLIQSKWTFHIKDGEPVGRDKSGGSMSWGERAEQLGYVKSPTGVIITIEELEYYDIRVYEDGRATCHFMEDEDHYDYFKKDKKSGNVTPWNRSPRPVGSSNQMKLVQYYLDAGFYSLKEVEKLKEDQPIFHYLYFK